MAKQGRKVSAADAALIERAVAVGGTAYRDNKGRVVALILKNVARLPLSDRKRLRKMINESEAEFRAHGGRILDMPNPAGLIGGVRYYATKKFTGAQLEDAIKVYRFTNAESRIEQLKRHAELYEAAEKLARELPVKEGRMSKDMRAIIPGGPFWTDLAHAEMLAIAYDAAPRINRDDSRQAGTRKKRGSRMPKLDKAIAEYLVVHPQASVTDIWNSLPSSRDDFKRAGIYRDGDSVVEYHDEHERPTGRAGFAKRVTAAKQKCPLVING